MKQCLRLIPTFKLRTASVIHTLLLAALAISTLFFAPSSLHAQTGGASPLQCQVSSKVDPISYAIVCSGTLPGGNVVLNCQSPDTINDNNGVFTVAGNCSENITLAGTTVAVTLTGAGLIIDSNAASISTVNGSGTIALADGLSTVAATCNGALLTENLSPFTLSIPDGSCTVTTGALGIGTAQIVIQAGSISMTNLPDLQVTINSPAFTANASLLGLINFSTTCGTSVSIKPDQLFPITIPALCSGP